MGYGEFMTERMRIAVLMSVHNRWEMTQEVLNKLAKAPEAIRLCVHVVDDGSTDATNVEIARFDNVNYLVANGDLFWAKSMKKAEESVIDAIDHFLWLNNDVNLSEDFFSTILKSINDFPNSILVGQTSNPITNEISYGGKKRIGRHPFRLSNIEAWTEHVAADTFCGNIALIPKQLSDDLGGIDGCFEHGYADYDFGYRAQKMGYKIWVIPGVLGTCAPNAIYTQSDTYLRTVKKIFQKKYLPIRSQFRFSRRHGGSEWFVYFLAPYVRTLLGLKNSGLLK
jgi:GT2 family glycosyltransferase